MPKLTGQPRHVFKERSGNPIREPSLPPFRVIVPRSGNAEPSPCVVAEGPCLPITRKEAPAGLREKLDLNCFVWWPLGQGAALSTMALVTRVHGPRYSHARQSSLLLDAACGIFVSP